MVYDVQMNAPLSAFRHKNLIYSIFSYLFGFWLNVFVGVGVGISLHSHPNPVKCLHLTFPFIDGIVVLCMRCLRELWQLSNTFSQLVFMFLLPLCNSLFVNVLLFYFIFSTLVLFLKLVLNNKQRAFCIPFDHKPKH